MVVRDMPIFNAQVSSDGKHAFHCHHWKVKDEHKSDKCPRVLRKSMLLNLPHPHVQCFSAQATCLSSSLRRGSRRRPLELTNRTFWSPPSP